MSHVRSLHYLLNDMGFRIGFRLYTDHPLEFVVESIASAVDEALVDYWWGLLLTGNLEDSIYRD